MPRFAVMLCLSGFLVGCGGAEQIPTPPVASADTPEPFDLDYSIWPTMTKTPYPVPPAFYAMCAAPTPERVKAHEDSEKKALGPHGDASIVIRVNPPGAKAFQAEKPVPVGTIIVKEKRPFFSEETPPAAIGVMIKREAGYDPTNGDWEYVYQQNQPEKSLIRGKLDSCIACHKQMQNQGYLFRTYLNAAKK